MGVIRQLPPSVINQIAAGEVVERPASVVKELLENAIDAGATRVDVSVERGGKDLVRIADNGTGMAPDDLMLGLSAARHQQAGRRRGPVPGADAGLSRRGAGGDRRGLPGPLPDSPGRRGRGIRDPDRGGDRRPDQELRLSARDRDRGAQPVLQHAGAADVSQVGLDRGGTRRRDLLPDRAGASRGPPDVPLGGQGRPRPAAGHGHARADRASSSAASWPSRCSGSRAGSTRSISGDTSRTHRRAGRAPRGSSCSWAADTFATGRSGMRLARRIADCSWSGAMPVAFLHLEIPPEEVDVNVHPTKIEVRFRDPQRVYSHLLSTLRQTFLTSDLHSRLQAVQEQPVEPAASAARTAGSLSKAGGIVRQHPRRAQVAGRVRRSSFRPRPPIARPSPAGSGLPHPADLDAAFPIRWAGSSLPSGRGRCRAGSSSDRGMSSMSSRTESAAAATRRTSGLASGSSSADGTLPADGSAAPAAARNWPGRQTKAIQVHDSYLIAETTEGMMVIDQHALHERILYEELRQRVAAGKVESQGLLVPEPVHLTADEAAVDCRSERAPGRSGARGGGVRRRHGARPEHAGDAGPPATRSPGSRPGRAPAHPAAAAHPRCAWWPSSCTWSPARRP